ncbi:MAG: hypothetical protein ABL957_15115 [Parvularculaceae bacterium]
MKSYNTRKAKDAMGAILKSVREEPVEIRRYGRQAAVMISPRDFTEYQALKALVNTECVTLAVKEALASFKMGDSARGHGVFRALAPYWAAAGVGGPPPRLPRLSVKPRRVTI